MGLFSGIRDALNDAFGGGDRRSRRGGARNSSGGLAPDRSPIPRLREDSQRFRQADGGEIKASSFRVPTARDNAKNISLFGGRLSLSIPRDPEIARAPVQRSNADGGRSRTGRIPGDRSRKAGRTSGGDGLEGVTQPVGRGRAVGTRIASDTPQRTAARRAAAVKTRRTGKLGTDQKPLLPVGVTSRALKALTGQ